MRIIEQHAKKEKTPVDIEIVRDIFHSFLRETIRNTTLFESKKLGASFPMSVIHTAQFAEYFYKKYSKKDPVYRPLTEEERNTKPEPSTKEFMFASLREPKGGSVVNYFEETLNRVMATLPASLKAIQRGEKPKNMDVYVLGSPIETLGDISKEFVESATQKPFDTLGELYAECVTAELGKEKTDRVHLVGYSMAGSAAIKTGEKLLHGGGVTQSPDVDMPQMQILAHVPVGSVKTKGRWWKMPLGIAKEFITNSYARHSALTEPKFIADVNDALVERGFEEHMSAKEKNAKKKVGSAINRELLEGVAVPKDLKVHIVRGINDPLSSSEEFKNDAQTDTPFLNSAIVPDAEHPNEKTYGIDQTHTPPFFRKNKAQRFIESAQILETLKKETA